MHDSLRKNARPRGGGDGVRWRATRFSIVYAIFQIAVVTGVDQLEIAMRRTCLSLLLNASVLLSAMAPTWGLAGQITVSIDGYVDSPPIITVDGAPHGYTFYDGLPANDPALEYGGLITLTGVDQFGPINPSEDGWRFVDPYLPADAVRNTLDIVWIQHDWAGTGDLQIGFNVNRFGNHYLNPALSPFHDQLVGPTGMGWVTVFSDPTLVLRFNAHSPPPPTVPEPTTLTLAGLGAVGVIIGAVRRRRKEKTVVGK